MGGMLVCWRQMTIEHNDNTTWQVSGVSEQTYRISNVFYGFSRFSLPSFIYGYVEETALPVRLLGYSLSAFAFSEPLVPSPFDGRTDLHRTFFSTYLQIYGLHTYPLDITLCRWFHWLFMIMYVPTLYSSPTKQ